jgi:dipeptidyl aminopeptidase/acylaminoacyl peptidase
MIRLRSRKLRNCILASLALASGLAGWLAYSRGQSSVSPSWPEVAELQPVMRQCFVPQTEYTISDGVILDGPSSSTRAGSKPQDVSAKVNSIDIRSAYERAAQLFGRSKGRVFKTSITPHWFDNNTRFWYRNDLRDGDKEFILVDADKGARRPAFDHKKLAHALSKAAGQEYRATRLPFDTITFTEGVRAVRFQAVNATWQCDLTTYECKPVPAPGTPPQQARPGAPVAFRALALVPASPALAAVLAACLHAHPAKIGSATPEESRPADVYPYDLDSPADDPALDGDEPQLKKKGFGKKPFQPQALREARSPDGKWTAFVKDHNVWLRERDGQETQLTKDGVTGNAYSAVTWAPDSKTLVAYRTEPGNAKEVYLIESSPRDQLAAKLDTRVYERPGDKFPAHEMWLFRVADAKPMKVDVERIELARGFPRLRWSKDGRHFTFEKADRGHQRFRVIGVDADTGETRNLIDERADTFIWTAHPPGGNMIPGIYLQYLDKSDEILYASQRDGWKHLYLIDAKTGQIKNQITKGEWVVRAVERVDEANRQIWFLAGGKNPGQDPYLIHYYRVNFDGTGLVALTETHGNHARPGGLQFSPDRKYFIDTYSRVDMAPVHELRRADDGKLVCKLDEADISDLLATGWRPPEVFVAKGRDAHTDIWGIVIRPQNFDPSKKYPVIEYIYAGPHSSHVPKTFAAYRPMEALAELGFIVVQIDGMGTANRSRAFHDVCWRNIADAGFPDRILWIKALAKKYAYVDIARVGIYGTSAGGQNALGALLFHPDFYKVAVASCGCHDNRLDKASWNEQWMGLIGPHYEKQSNVTNAHKLQGKLLLIVGELDKNVPPESTLRVVDALIRARKDFDLLVVPGMGHSNGGPYGDRRRNDFFVRHLHGIEPPDRNAAPPAAPVNSDT